MKTPLKTLLAALLLAHGAWAGAAPATAWEKIKSYAHESKTEAVAEARRLVSGTDKQIAALKEQVATSTGQAKAAHERNLAELSRKRQQAQTELDRMQGAAAGTWATTRDGFAAAYKDLRESYDKARAAAPAAPAAPAPAKTK